MECDTGDTLRKSYRMTATDFKLGGIYTHTHTHTPVKVDESDWEKRGSEREFNGQNS